jgi:hypothetical protein
VPAATPIEISSLISTLRTATPLGRLNIAECNAVFAQLATLGWSVLEPGSTGDLVGTYGDTDILIGKLLSTTGLSRLSRIEAHAVFDALPGGFLIARPANLALRAS